MHSAGGHITISSTDPFAAPIIDPNYLTAPFDIVAMREAVKSARQFFAAPSWDGYVIEEFGAFAQAQTDDEIEVYARANAQTIDHICCTAAMGPNGTSGAAGEGVLDSDLTVKGAKGLRVVDASAFVSCFLWISPCRRGLLRNLCFVLAVHPCCAYPDCDICPC